MIYELDGMWEADIGDGKIYPMHLPGTLDENRIGYKDSGKNQWHPDTDYGGTDIAIAKDAPIATRLTRKYTYEGVVRLTRRVSFKIPEGERVFLEAERARCLRLFVDGKEVPYFRKSSISTPHVFELTGFLKGSHELTLLSDNSYVGLPHDDILYSSAATDETQTNWNGILGYFRLRTEKPVFLEDVRVYPKGNTVTVQADVCTDRPWTGELSLYSEVLGGTVVKAVSVDKGRTEVELGPFAIAGKIARWDEYEGSLCHLTAALSNGTKKNVSFGVRDFGSDREGRLALNGRRIFLRGETNCAVFPETGYIPMSVEEWTDILYTYKDYGVNCVRFHSHCPPEAAFTVADRMGMLMQPELSHWNPKDAFETEESFSYYRTELLETLRMLANHPSFVMLTLGNELHATETGQRRMGELLRLARQMDSTRLYANGSNVHYGMKGCDAESDFYTAMGHFDRYLRGISANMKGHINENYPNAKTDYDNTMDEVRKTYQKPVFGFEVGQFEVLPDFEELEEFRGVTEPINYRQIQRNVEEKGLSSVWKQYVEATGELSCIGYREEVEAAMRTEGMSGLSFLSLQDFPGQGTALIGMLNAHMRPKPYNFAKPERFCTFFTSQLPLVLLPRYTYENTEILEAEVKIANYGKDDLAEEVYYELQGPDFCLKELEKGCICPAGTLTEVGKLRFPLAAVEQPARLELRVSMGRISNTYPVWVYPVDDPAYRVCPKTVYEARHFDKQAREVLKAGGIVYLSPPSTKEALPYSVQAQFSTDFWSVGTFASQEGCMGQLIDAEHPVFRRFPTEFHTNWQWWPMAIQRAAILPKRYEAIIIEMDSYAYLRPMAQLLECRCGKGRLLFSTMGLQDLQKYPEARALLNSIYRYLESEEFAPEQEIGAEVIEKLVN